MDFELSEKSRAYLKRLGAFMDEHIYPNEERFYAQHREGDRWAEPPLLAEMKTSSGLIAVPWKGWENTRPKG